MSHAHAFSCMRTLHLVYFYIFELFGAFLIVSFFPLSLLFTLVRQWHQNISLLHPRTLCILGVHFMFWSYPFFYSVPWWGCPKGLLGELFSTRCSFETPSHFGGLCQQWPTRCHSQSGSGVTAWHTSHMSFHVDPRVLLQHAWNWFFNTSLSYSRSRYAYCCYTRVGIRCASCPEGRASWLPQLLAPEDYVWRRAYVSFCECPFDWGDC